MAEQPNHVKHYLQIVGAVLMLLAIFHFDLLYHYEFEPKLFAAGALIFLSTFLTWKPKKPGDDD